MGRLERERRLELGGEVKYKIPIFPFLRQNFQTQMQISLVKLFIMNLLDVKTKPLIL